MALFTFNRYMGDEETSGVTLEQIHKVARERQEKRKKLPEAYPEKSDHSDEVEPVLEDRKRKKKRLETDKAAVESKQDKKEKRQKRKFKDLQALETVKECKAPMEAPDNETTETTKDSSTCEANLTVPEPSEGLSVITHQAVRHKTLHVQYQLPNWATQYHPIEQDIATHSLPLDDFDIPGVIKDNLASLGVTTLFPVQAHVIPELLASSHAPLITTRKGVAPSDIFVCAPTGCGKTLAYVVPIVAALMERSVCHLRALVVLPSRDLALQVYKVLEKVCHRTRVEVGVVCGGKSLVEEKGMICCSLGSLVDVLVATPGRLVSHIQENALFTLQYLRYLVIDEADRLFEQKYHNWLEGIMEGVRKPYQPPSLAAQMLESSMLPQVFPSMCSLAANTSLEPRPHPPLYNSCPTRTVSNVLALQSSLQKLLFSATISLDPEQLSLLELHRPKLFSVEGVSGELVGQSTLPSTLEERVVMSTADHKPLVLLHLLHTLEHHGILCFTHSRQATHRLSLLLRQYGASVAELSSTATHGAKSEIIGQLGAGKLKVQVLAITALTFDLRPWCVPMGWPGAWTFLELDVSLTMTHHHTFARTCIGWAGRPGLGQVASHTHY